MHIGLLLATTLRMLPSTYEVLFRRFFESIPLTWPPTTDELYARAPEGYVPKKPCEVHVNTSPGLSRCGKV